MGVSSVRFSGRDLYQPGYYGKRNISALDIGSATGSRLLLIGECKGGIPFNAVSDYPNAEDRVNWVSNTDELKNVLRDGPAYYGALFALTPSNQNGVNGAPAVGVIRINKATKGSSSLNDVDGDPILEIKSLSYGLFVNQIRFKISDGTSKGKKITVKFEDQTIEGDNITNELFTIQYTGTGTACSMILDPEGNLSTTVSGGPGGEDLSIDVTSFDNISSLVAYINSMPSYSAVVSGDGIFSPTKLDKIVAGDSVDIKTEYTVKAILDAVISWFNNSSTFLTAEITTSGTPERRIVENTTDYVFLTGGSDGSTPIQQDWQDAIDQIAKNIDASFIGVMTDNLAVQSSLSAHVTYMSSIDGKNERQACVGSGSSDNKQTKIAAAKALNNSLVGYFGTEIKRYDKNGDLKEWPGFYGACEILGMSAGNAINFSPTNKSINAIGIKEVYSSTDKDDYIKAGIMIASTSSLGGIRIVRAITTYQSSNIIANEWSAMRTSLYIVKDHRVYVESLVGIGGDNTALESIKNRAYLRLDYYVEQGWLVVDPELGNAYRNFNFSVNADTISISYEGTLIIPVNFILVTHNFTVVGAKK